MDKTKYLLTVLAQEGAKVSQAASDVIRFGAGVHFEYQLLAHIHELTAVMEMLQEIGPSPLRKLSKKEADLIKANWKKAVTYFLDKAEREANPPLTFDELKALNEDEYVWVEVIDHTVFADPTDDFDGYGVVRKSWVRLWDGKRADLVHVDYHFEEYGKVWRAYRHKLNKRNCPTHTNRR